MPFLSFDGPNNLSKETKKRLIKELTITASQILNIPPQSFMVVLKENNPDNIGVGGVPLSEKIKDKGL